MEHPDAASRHFDGGFYAIDFFSVTALLALLSSAALTQESSGTKGETIGHPPPLPGPPPIAGPPPISEPSPTMQPAPAASTPRASEPASKGNTYVPATLPRANIGPGLNVPGPDDSTKTVKAVPCSTAARETDGSTTCVGIPDKRAKAKNRRWSGQTKKPTRRRLRTSQSSNVPRRNSPPTTSVAAAAVVTSVNATFGNCSQIARSSGVTVSHPNRNMYRPGSVSHPTCAHVILLTANHFPSAFSR